MSQLSGQEEIRSAKSGEEIDVRWLMPEEFFELPMDFEDPDAIAEQLLELAERVLPGADPELQIEWAAMCGRITTRSPRAISSTRPSASRSWTARAARPASTSPSSTWTNSPRSPATSPGARSISSPPRCAN
ncbi:hypothetical protein NKH77_23385 [Streptomyces sp. M19]